MTARTVICIAEVQATRVVQMGGPMPPGVGLFVGWPKVALALQAAGVIRPSENLSHVIVTNEGLELRFK